MIFIVLWLITMGILALDKNGGLTNVKSRHLMSIIILSIAAVLCTIEYGVLRGIFVWLGAGSLIGTAFALIKFKFAKPIENS